MTSWGHRLTHGCMRPASNASNIWWISTCSFFQSCIYLWIDCLHFSRTSWCGLTRAWHQWVLLHLFAFWTMLENRWIRKLGAQLCLCWKLQQRKQNLRWKTSSPPLKDSGGKSQVWMGKVTEQDTSWVEESYFFYATAFLQKWSFMSFNQFSWFSGLPRYFQPITWFGMCAHLVLQQVVFPCSREEIPGLWNMG